MQALPPGCSHDLAGWQVDHVRRVRGWVPPWLRAGGCLHTLFMGTLLGLWPFVSVLVATTVLAPISDAVGDPGLVGALVCCSMPLLAIGLVGRVQRGLSQPLRADARYLSFGAHRWPRDQVVLQQDGPQLTLLVGDEAFVVEGSEQAMRWFVDVTEARAPQPAGDARDIPPALRAVAPRQPER